ncbi:hypothetical protein Tco_0517166 [Tanacetum coccineum]
MSFQGTLDNIMVAMPKLVEEGFYTCNVCVEYEWKPPRSECCKVFGHVQDVCPKDIDSDVVKNTKKPSQTPRGVLVGPKVGFKPDKQVYRHVLKRTMPTLVTTSATSIVEKIDKMERLIIERKVTLVNDEGKSLKKIDSSCDYDSKDEVASGDNNMANFMASKKVNYGTNSLLE